MPEHRTDGAILDAMYENVMDLEDVKRILKKDLDQLDKFIGFVRSDHDNLCTSYKSKYEGIMEIFHQIIIIELYNLLRSEIELIGDDLNKIQEDLLQAEMDDHWDQIKEYLSNAHGKFKERLRTHFKRKKKYTALPFICNQCKHAFTKEVQEGEVPECTFCHSENVSCREPENGMMEADT